MWLRFFNTRRSLVIAIVAASPIITNASAAEQRSLLIVPGIISGVRHRVDASIRAEAAAASAPVDADGYRASTVVTFVISDEARESRFFGQVKAVFPDFVPREGAAEKIVWQDSKCHQRRGLPKVEIVALDGRMSDQSKTVAISARPRRIGMRLPLDEIVQGIKLPNGIDRVGRFLSYRAITKQSHLMIDLKIYEIDCDLISSNATQ